MVGRVAALAAFFVLAVPGLAHAAVFPFPSDAATDTGATLSETFRTTRNVNRAILRVAASTEDDTPVTWALEIAGREVGRFEVPSAAVSLDVSFPTITGRNYPVTLRRLSGASDTYFEDGSIELLDTIAPDTHIGFSDATAYRVGTPVATPFGASSHDVAAFECSLDDVAFTACTSPVTFSLPIGSHTIRVRAIDDAGNVDATPATRTWLVLPPPACPGGAATVQAGSVTTLSLGCVGNETPGTFISRPPQLGALGAVDEATQTVAYTAPPVAGLTSFTYRARSTKIATFDLTIRGPIGSGVHAAWRVTAGRTTARRLSVTDVPALARVRIGCMHKGCTYRRTWQPTATPRKALNLLGSLSRRRLRPGTVVEVRVAAPYATTKVVRYTMRAHRSPLRAVVQPPRSKK